MILFAFFFVAFKKKGAGNEFILLVPFNVEDVEFLSTFNEALPCAVRGWLECGAKLKLNIVHKSARGGPTLGFADIIHELDSAFPVVEDD